jgi:hypothetical protein
MDERLTLAVKIEWSKLILVLLCGDLFLKVFNQEKIQCVNFQLMILI